MPVSPRRILWRWGSWGWESGNCRGQKTHSEASFLQMPPGPRSGSHFPAGHVFGYSAALGKCRQWIRSGCIHGNCVDTEASISAPEKVACAWLIRTRCRCLQATTGQMCFHFRNKANKRSNSGMILFSILIFLFQSSVRLWKVFNCRWDEDFSPRSLQGGLCLLSTGVWVCVRLSPRLMAARDLRRHGCFDSPRVAGAAFFFFFIHRQFVSVTEAESFPTWKSHQRR